jgi:DNA-binding CsgD family transcriptional regulator
MIGQDPVANCWVSAMVRNSQGFFRDVIESNLGRFASDCHLMIVELAMGSDGVDPAALAVFAAATSLSKAEADLVKAIANGHSLSELAEARGVAVSTIRQRMKSVLAKTGCRRQTELVRLVLSLCPKRPSDATSGILSTRPSRPAFAPSAAPSLMP